MIKKDLVVIKNADLVISMDEGRRILTNHDIVISQGEIQKVEKNTQLSGGEEIIDAAGCRGHTVGDAMVSEKHCNFLINTDSATATDLETLGDYVQKQVLHTTIKRCKSWRPQ